MTTGIMHKDSAPENVKQQLQEAEAIIAQIDRDEPAPTGLGELSLGNEGERPGEPEASQEQEDDVETLRQKVQDLTNQLVSLQAALADESRDTWRHKFSVMEGKYRAETAPALRRVHELETENQRLKSVIAETAGEEKIPLAPDDEALMDRLAVDESTYRLMVKRMAGTKPQQVESGPQADPARTAYFTVLDSKADGWKEAKNDPAFAQYLNGTRESVGGEPGRTLMEVLIDADAALNADTVARVYQAFFRTLGPRRPSREAAATNQRGGSSLPGETTTWNLQKIAQFEEDCATGKIKMGSEKYKKLKASIDQAP